MTPDARRLISLVVPVLNEEDNIDQLYAAAERAMRALPEFDYEFVFTDNHSTDGTFARLHTLAERDPRVRVLRFSRNFGYQRSIYTGYLHCRGDAAIQLDCDLQDPPDMIVEFVRHWQDGCHVVYGVRRSRQEGWLINLGRKAFYRLIDALSEDRLPLDAGDFRLIDRRVINELKRIDDYHPYVRGLIATMGFRQVGVPYDRRERARGTSKFSLSSLVRLAIDGILSHSIIPLRMASLFGIGTSLLTALGVAGYGILKVVFGREWPAGFATTTMLLLFSLSLISMFLGIIGEYLGRIYQQLKRRPLTIIQDAINVPLEESVCPRYAQRFTDNMARAA
jgi:polyisoprenyl-phosphate glycosyltransferase